MELQRQITALDTQIKDLDKRLVPIQEAQTKRDPWVDALPWIVLGLVGVASIIAWGISRHGEQQTDKSSKLLKAFLQSDKSKLDEDVKALQRELKSLAEEIAKATERVRTTAEKTQVQNIETKGKTL